MGVGLSHRTREQNRKKIKQFKQRASREKKQIKHNSHDKEVNINYCFLIVIH